MATAVRTVKRAGAGGPAKPVAVPHRSAARASVAGGAGSCRRRGYGENLMAADFFAIVPSSISAVIFPSVSTHRRRERSADSHGSLASGRRAHRLERFEDRYNGTAVAFDWRFTTADLARLLQRLDAHQPDAPRGLLGA